MVSNIELRVPMEEDFSLDDFLWWVKQTHRERILRDQFNPPYSIYSYSKKNRIITSYFHTSDDQLANKLIEDIPLANKLIENITNDGYSVVITKKWRALIHPIITKMIENSQFEECLPDESKELLMLIGTSKDRIGISKSVYYILKSAPSDVTTIGIWYDLLPGAQFESAALNETKRPRFYSSKSELPIPISEDLGDDLVKIPEDEGDIILLCDDSYDFQKTISAIHTCISNIAKNNPHWKIVDIDNRTELSVEELFDKYYSP